MGAKLGSSLRHCQANGRSIEGGRPYVVLSPDEVRSALFFGNFANQNALQLLHEGPLRDRLTEPRATRKVAPGKDAWLKYLTPFCRILILFVSIYGSQASPTQREAH